MRIKQLVFGYAILCLTGCLTNDSLETTTIANRNVSRLRQLCIGMSEEEVFVRMRTPEKIEQVVIGEDQYDFWFYITQGTCMEQRALMHRNLTPVTFKNDRLIGIGYTIYDRIIRMASTPESHPKEEDQEDHELEKTLKPKETPKKKAPSRVSLKEQKPEKKPPKEKKSKSEEEEEQKPYLDDDGRRMLKNEQDEDFSEP